MVATRRRTTEMRSLMEIAREQDEIIAKYGREALLDASARLCESCERYEEFSGIVCNRGLLPLTTEGKDCPYLEEKGGTLKI